MSKQTSSSIDDILKSVTLYAFRKGNWQEPIDPNTDPHYKEAKQSIAQKLREEVLKGQRDLVLRLRDATRKHTANRANISHISVANEITTHTSSLLEAKLVDLEAQLQGGKE